MWASSRNQPAKPQVRDGGPTRRERWPHTIRAEWGHPKTPDQHPPPNPPTKPQVRDGGPTRERAVAPHTNRFSTDVSRPATLARHRTPGGASTITRPTSSAPRPARPAATGPCRRPLVPPTTTSAPARACPRRTSHQGSTGPRGPNPPPPPAGAPPRPATVAPSPGELATTRGDEHQAAELDPPHPWARHTGRPPNTRRRRPSGPPLHGHHRASQRQGASTTARMGDGMATGGIEGRHVRREPPQHGPGPDPHPGTSDRHHDPPSTHVATPPSAPTNTDRRRATPPRAGPPAHRPSAAGQPPPPPRHPSTTGGIEGRHVRRESRRRAHNTAPSTAHDTTPPQPWARP